ncbi:acetoacetate--CoA ligase [Limoniibacter endophyticus]|uniref:Acetoacetate-CoA ligase n=1 Tax=Limoniibacter endophyticus TaxID=1565040 RepID=A0A8J3DHL5_9HYPH|nr:acetoacetate--CoA ligase [Limoniibacter endophyticus]GHC67732.1 acetoacetate-CoA ligase [Limoniibacter endophyticus]
MNQAIWTPSAARVAETNLTDFMKKIGKSDYAALHAWSVDDIEGFWEAIWDYCGIVGERGDTVLRDGEKMPGATFFPHARLNYAENLLQEKGAGDALVFRAEAQVERRVSWDELRADVSRLQQWFKSLGIKPGDRIAAMMPNMPETIVAMLAATSMGAVWSSCSPDFGEKGVLDRFSQIEPALFVTVDGYWYNGKRIDISEKVSAVCKALPSVRNVLIADFLGGGSALAESLAAARTFDDVLQSFAPHPVEFTRLPFNHPLYILFSSGTTGIPKCIVHCAGGVLLQHAKEHVLHLDIKPGDRVYHFTTCGWMMWNWIVSTLARRITLLLYDGSPFYPDGNVQFDFAQAEKMTYFGTSAKFLDAARKAGIEPIKTHDLSHLRCISSTGSPLATESFHYVYQSIKNDIHLSSMSGGTDLVACLVAGVPVLPVHIGEIQGAALGMAVDVFDQDAKPVRGEKGELVCTKPFPSMPLYFWNDPKSEKYHAAYFDRFENIWCHGDFAERTPHDGIIIHGRSDATLNPGGVRIGTAEIYNQVEQMPEVLEALCVGQEWDHDVRVVLFARLAEGVTLDDALEKRIREVIRKGASPRHVPAKIIAVADIPRTKSGKITELAVREIIHGRAVKNSEALANPGALDLYRHLPQLQD